MRRWLMALFLIALPCCVRAADRGAEASIDIEQLASRYNVPIVRRNDGGAETAQVIIKGVSFSRTRQGGKEFFLAQDESGLGAVMCAWNIYSVLRAGMDFCMTEDHQEAKEVLSDALQKMNAFIAANSIFPVTIDQLDREMADSQRRALEGVKKLKPEEIARACTSGDLSGFYNQFLGKSREEYQIAVSKMKTDLEKLLSAPRPPVMLPCL